MISHYSEYSFILSYRYSYLFISFIVSSFDKHRHISISDPYIPVKLSTNIMELFPNAGRGTSSNDDTIATASASGQMVDLRDKIDKSNCYARNEAKGYPMSNLFIGDSRLGCKSDVDEQLILHIAFQEFVKVGLLLFLLVIHPL